MKKLTDKAMRDAIREAYRKFGKDHPHDGIISWVRKTYHCEPPTYQKVLGVRSRILIREWWVWEEERNRAEPEKGLQGFNKTTDEDGDEVVETYTPKEHYETTGSVGTITKELVKQDHEIVAVLNLCVDWNKFHRFMTLSDMKRLNRIGQEGGLAFLPDPIRFGYVEQSGAISPCSFGG